jgi:hypothetical protein
MSIAEFFIENGIYDAETHDDFLRRLPYLYGDDDVDDEEEKQEEAQPPVYFSGLAVVQQDTATRQGLDENRLDGLATTHGWKKLSTETSRAAMTSYSRQDMRLNFWLSTGTVGSYLDHPHQGKTQLFRREVDMKQAEDIFVNPRVHTGAGYQRREHDKKRKSPQVEPEERRACRYGSNCHKRDCQFAHTRGPCRFGSKCNRAGCWFDHP